MLEQQLVNALSLGCVYALFALGFTLVFGVLGVINLSHGAIFMIGAYAALQTVTKLANTSVNASATQAELLSASRAPVAETSRIVQGTLTRLPTPLSNSTRPLRKV